MEHKKTAKNRDVPSSGLNEPAIEAMQAYSEKANKWELDVLRATADYLFELVMEMSNRHAEPLNHLRNFMLKVFTEDEINEDGGHLARLVDSKAKEIKLEYEQQLTDDTWLTAKLNARPFDDNTKEQSVDMSSGHPELLIRGFTRRILANVKAILRKYC